MNDLQIPDQIVISDLESLKMLSDPLRMEILKQIGIINLRGQRATVKEISKILEMPPTKLYYHVNLLEDAELLIVGDTQVVSGIIEKHYQVCAMNISVSKNLMAANNGDKKEQLDSILEAIQQILNNATQNLTTSLTKMYEESKIEKEGGPPARKQVQLNVSADELQLTIPQAEEYVARLAEIHQEYDQLSNKNIAESTSDSLFFGTVQMIVPHYHRTPNPNAETDQENE